MFYKVLRREKGKLYSAVMRREMRHSYAPGVTIYPKVGCLFAFESKERGRLFLESEKVFSSTLELWECLGLVDYELRVKGVPHFVVSEDIERFWPDYWEKVLSLQSGAYIYAFSQGGLEVGTELCKWLKPVRRISFDTKGGEVVERNKKGSV